MKKSYVLLSILSYVAILASLYMALIYAPTEKSMGAVQRIFYFHVPSAWVSFIAFGVVAVASFLFLRSGAAKWDLLARSAAEVGMLFLTLVLLTGPLWAKPVWGVYWTWDARLTTSFILWLIYMAYLMLRSYVVDRERGARFAAVFGIIGFLDVPIVYMSIRWWRTLHPSAVIAGSDGSGLESSMLQTLLVCVVAFTLLFITLLIYLYQSTMLSDEIEQLKTTDS
ncbi:cytochrome c biogenesis protein CcsA [candidate division KSB1 bacterium]|nr:cytochrome c biogenesis protein CcsA [candidate division KSB1 bacterium]